MRNVWLLLKNYFLCGIGSFRRKNTRRKTIVGVFTAVVIYGVIFTLMLKGMLNTAKYSVELKMQSSVLALGLIISVFIAVVFALQKVTGGKKDNDTELLLSMPVTKTEIMTAKALSRFAFNLALVVLMFLPCVIAYFVYTPFNLVAMLGCIVVMLLIPLMAVGLSYVVDYLVTVCFPASKFGNIVKTFFTLIVLIGVIAIYEFFVLNLENASMMLKVVNWMITFNPLIMVPLIGGGIAVFVFGNWLNALLLNRESRAPQAKPTRISSKLASPFGSILKNESNRYFNSPTLMLNTMIGPLFMVALTGWVLIDQGKTITSYLVQSLGITQEILALIIGLIFAGLGVMTYPAAVSISLEGKQLWILRSMPVHASTVLSAKVLFNILLVAPLSLVCNIILQIVLQLSVINFLFMTIIPILSSVLVAYTGILINLCFPKFEFESETAVIKQSLSAFIMMFGGMIMIGALVGLSFWLLHYLSFILVAAIIIGLLVLAIGIVVTLTYTVGRRIFNRL